MKGTMLVKARLRNLVMVEPKIHRLGIYVAIILSWFVYSKYQYGLREWSSAEAGTLARKIATVAIVFVAIAMICVFESKRLSDLKKFACIYVMLSAIYFCALPMYREADGIAHFARAYEISEGYMLSDINNEGIGGRELPQGLFLDMDDDLKKIPDGFEKRLGDDRIFMNFWAASLYNPVTYFPQAAGIFGVRLFTDRVLLMAYAARAVNWLVGFVLIFLSIKHVPGTRRKMLMMLISLLPMSIHQAISLSSDGMVLGLSFAMVSFCIYMRYNHADKLKCKHLFFMYCIAILISIYKIVYMPFCLLLFLIPSERFRSMKSYMMHVLILGMTVLLISFGWLAVSSKYLIEVNEGVNGSEQIAFILQNLHTYLWIMVKTILINFESYYYSLIGSPLGRSDIQIGFMVILICSIPLFAALLCKGNGNQVNKVEVVFSNIVSACVVGLIFTSLYVQWTFVGSDIIYGIQGRYFIPVLFPLAMGVMPDKCMNIALPFKTLGLPMLFANVCAGMVVFYTCFL